MRIHLQRMRDEESVISPEEIEATEQAIRTYLARVNLASEGEMVVRRYTQTYSIQTGHVDKFVVVLNGRNIAFCDAAIC